ncbi:MAG TPA: alpha-2-macroglobulin family protein, partial [Bacteroidota bacterium]|nr:alpha-2-macroglobulin family protein [Bacteroidota bacterium]
VADKGVLNLIGYRLPDPFVPFYGQRPLSVVTTESRSQIVQARSFGEKGEDEGGGGGADFGGVEARGNFKSTAYWNAHLLTDSAGKLSFTFRLPDNLTTFSIMCVAQTKQSEFGYGESSIVVNKPLLLLPSLPRFARAGDQFQAGVLVHNFTKSQGTVRVHFEARGIEWKGKEEVEFLLGAGESKEVRQPVHASRTGKAVFTFKARMGKETDGLTVSIPVQVAPRRETVADFHAVAASTDLKLIIPENRIRGMGTIEFTASSTALSGLQSSVEYLFTYPYGCIEQKCSAVLPLILGREMVEAFGLQVLKGIDARAVVQKALNELRRFQLWNGGFSYWPGGAHEAPYASAYVMYVLASAKRHGYFVPDELLHRGINYVKNVLRWPSGMPQYPLDEQEWALTKTFILYTLALLGTPEPAYYETFFKMRDRIPLEARAYLLRAIAVSTKQRKMMDALTENLLNNLKVNP